MREIRMQGLIGSDRTLHLTLPEDVAEGMADVLVRVPENRSESAVESHREMLQRVRSSIRKKRGWDEIQLLVEDERKSWD